MNENQNNFEEDQFMDGREGSNETEDGEMEGRQSHEDEEDEDSPRGPLSQRVRAPRSKRQKRDSSSNESTDEDHIAAEESFTTAPLSEKDKLINIGSDYQAVILPASGPREEEEDRDQKMWEYPEDINDRHLTDYVCETSGRFRLPVDWALFLLRKNDYDFDAAIMQASKKRQVRDRWSDHDIAVFTTCYFHFGKRFRKIRAVMPHRPICSIVQFYYDTKKSRSYKTVLDVKLNLNEPDLYDELMREVNKNPRNLNGVCENCGEKVALLIFNSGMNRHECKSCVLYFRLMRTPRRADIKITAERARKHVTCPEYMKQYVVDYESMIKPADGKAFERLGIGRQKEVDDECMIVDECPLRQPSAPYIVELTENDDPVDSNTCRMTRDFESESVQETIRNIRKSNMMSVPLVWRQKQTRCMEDIELLNEEARRTNTQITELINKVNTSSVAKWKKEMASLRERTGSWTIESHVPVASGSRSGRVRHNQNWSDDEKRNVVRCFHWYRDEFDLISEVMGTKTSEQVKAFYENNKEVIDNSIEKYTTEVRGHYPFFA